jgi:hypothetical protein
MAMRAKPSVENQRGRRDIVNELYALLFASSLDIVFAH